MRARECGAVVKFMLAGFPAQRQKMSDADVDAMTEFYYGGLADLDAEVVKAAISRLGRTAKFIPTVAEIREAVGVVHHGEQLPAVIAWGEIHNLIRSKGYYRTPGVDFQITDPIAAEVVRSIGWSDMCASESPDHIRARFMDGYAQASKLARKEAAALPGGKSPALASRATADRIGGGATLAQLMPAVKPEDDEK